MPYVETRTGRLFYADDDFVDPWRAHDTVFMQPWLLGNHTRFRAWVPPFAGDHRVVRMDRRGLGRSDAPSIGWAPTLASVLDDFVRVLDAIAVEQVHFLGESTGGLLGIAFAARHPERVKSLVLCATPTQLASAGPGLAVEPYPDGASSVEAMGSHRYAEALGARAAEHASNPSEITERFGQVATIPTHVVAAILRMATDPALDVTDLLPDIQAPVLLLTPGNSQVVDRAAQEQMRASIPRCEQVVFEGASHSIFFDERDRCQTEALRFIGRVSHPDVGAAAGGGA